MTTKLATLRATQKALRRTFEEQKRQEWIELTAELEARVSAEVTQLFNAGLPISKIMREYGTSDYRTVRDRVIEVRAEDPADAPMTLAWKQVKDGIWDVTDGTHTATVVVLEDEGVTMLNKTDDPAFGARLNMEAGFSLWQSR